MSLWVVIAGLLGGLGLWLVLNELIPAGPSLLAAIARLDAARNFDASRDLDAARDAAATKAFGGRLTVRAAELLKPAAPWIPVPAADLRLLQQDKTAWLASKVTCAVLGLALVPVLTALLAIGGKNMPWAVPAGGTLVLGAAMFFTPDLVTRVNAAERRADFRHALTSYLDLVALERGAGAAPTEALEAAADIGGGWAFDRIGAALDRARRASLPPWDGLARLAREIEIPELADLAEIAGVAGQDGARILETLSARAESMRAEALAATKARANARSTTMVLPIAMLAGGFLVLLIFPDFYRLFG
jgi:Flp pilus assembly protein TadB